MRLKKSIAVILSVFLIFGLSACSSEKIAEQERAGTVVIPKPVLNTSNEFTADDISGWGSSMVGRAEQDGEYVKIYAHKNQYGGVKSPYRTKIDFSKEAFLNVYGFSSVSERVTLVVKIFFVGYSERYSSYVMSNDFVGLNGDFSINIDNGLQRYGSDPVNLSLYDSGGGLRMAGDTVETQLELWAYNNTGSGYLNSEAWVRFKKISITNSEEKPVRSFKVNGNGVNVNNDPSSALMTRTKDDVSVTLTPVSEPAMDKSQMIFSTSDMEKAPISGEGILSFNGVTRADLSVAAYPRADIALGGNTAYGNSRLSERSGFYLKILGKITTSGVFGKVSGLFGSGTSAEADEDFNDLFEGNLLQAQRLAPEKQLSGLQLIAAGSTMTVVNAYDPENDEDAGAAEESGGSYGIKLNVRNAPDGTSESETGITVVRQAGGELFLEYSGTVEAGDEYIHPAEYLDGGEKNIEDSRYLAIWSQAGANDVLTRFDVHNVDASGITRYSPEDIEAAFGQDRGWDGLSSGIDENGEFEIKLTLRDVTAFYAQPFVEMRADTASVQSGLKIDFLNKHPKMIIEFGDTENMSLNIRFFRIGGVFVNDYWNHDGFNTTNIDIDNQKLVFVDLDHYASLATNRFLIQSSVTKSLPVELNFDLQLKEREEVGAVGYMRIKSIFVYYE